jgi:hypothetical protein
MAGSIETHWFVENRVRLLTAFGHLELETVKIFDEATRRFYDAATQPVHVILDVRQLKTVPPISELLKMSTLWHKRQDFVATVGAMRQPLMRLLFTTLLHVGRLNYRDVDTVAEAKRLIIGYEPTLPPLETWSPSPFAETHP